MKQPNGYSTPAPKSSAAKQWAKELAQTKEEEEDEEFTQLVLHSGLASHQHGAGEVLAIYFYELFYIRLFVSQKTTL